MLEGRKTDVWGAAAATATGGASSGLGGGVEEEAKMVVVGSVRSDIVWGEGESERKGREGGTKLTKGSLALQKEMVVKDRSPAAASPRRFHFREETDAVAQLSVW